MRKLILFLSVIFVSATIFSQRVYFSTGANFSKYNFISPTPMVPMSTQLKGGSGSNYEMGFSKDLKSKNFLYTLGVNLNEYNAIAGDMVNSYTWNTKFLGFSNSLETSVELIWNFRFMIQGGLNLSTIVYGKQSINGAYYDLVRQKEFSGLNITPFANFSICLPFQKLGFLSLGYGINKSFFPMNSSDEKLSITTNQIRFGIHFNIN